MIFTERFYEKGGDESTKTRGQGGDDDDERRDEEYCLYIAKRAKIARNVARFRGSFTGDVKRFLFVKAAYSLSSTAFFAFLSFPLFLAKLTSKLARHYTLRPRADFNFT